MNNDELYLIPGYSRYKITRSGKVISFTGHELTTRTGNNGYVQVSATRDDGRHGSVEIHRLIALAFVENKTNLDYSEIEVNHRNGDKSDNSPENLEWCTHSENEKHAYSEGLNSNCTMIHAMPVSGGDDILCHSLRAMASEFNCSVGTMQWLLNESKRPYKGYWFGYCDGRSNCNEPEECED